jgi:hypothetical protein
MLYLRLDLVIFLALGLSHTQEVLSRTLRTLRLLYGLEELHILLGLGSLCNDVEVRWEKPLLFIALVDKVIDGRNLVVFVVVDALSRIVRLEAKLLQHLKNLRGCRDSVLANDQSLVLAHWLPELEPAVLADLGFGIAEFRVCVEHFRDHVCCIRGNKVRQSILAFEDLLVESRSVWVFERQISTDHSIKDDATTPDVNLSAMVLESLYHLGGSVAG